MQLRVSSTLTIVGYGRVGKAVAKLIAPKPIIVRRGDAIPNESQGPIFVCTTNDALEELVLSVPSSRHKDLVFMQNGMLLPWLDRHHLQNNTTVLLYMSAHDDGSFFDGKRTVVQGSWAEHVCKVFQAGGLTCQTMNGDEYTVRLVEKLLWSCVFWLLSNALGGITVGEVCDKHWKDVEELVEELLPLVLSYLHARGSGEQASNNTAEGRGAPLEAGTSAVKSGTAVTPSTETVLEGLWQYSQLIRDARPSKTMALVEFEWRNGFFLGQAGTPLHLHWLHQACTHQELLLTKCVPSKDLL